MEDTTARWRSVMGVLGQSGTEIRPVLGHLTCWPSVEPESLACLTMSHLHTTLHIPGSPFFLLPHVYTSLLSSTTDIPMSTQTQFQF